MTVRTRFAEGDIAKFVSNTDSDDDYNGRLVVVTAVNPIPLVMREPHYRVFVPGALDESYVYATELYSKESK